MFDSHCHLHDARLVADAGEVWARAEAVGVTEALLAGVDPAGWLDEARLCLAYTGLHASYGIHPQIVALLDDKRLDQMLLALEGALGEQAPLGVRAVALGEIGLDGVDERRGSLDLQERAFRAQLQLARRLKLPLSLHILQAHGRAISVLCDEGVSESGGVVHSYSGSHELLRDYLGLGLSVSFAGPVGNPAAKKARKAAEVVPRERLLVETDAPDQTPGPHRPQRNEPAFLVANIAALAQIRGESPAEVAAYTHANARRLFCPMES